MATVSDIPTAVDIGLREEPSNRTDSARSSAAEAIAKAKREGLELAVKARWVALAVIAVMVPFLNPNWEVLYYIALIGLFALIGLAHLRVGTAGRSRPELLLLFCDLALLTIVTVVPNPWTTVDWPTAVQYRFDNFIYFFVFLAAGTLAYNWRTVIAMGVWTTGLWLTGVVCVVLFPNAKPELSARIGEALDGDDRLRGILDPNTVDFGLRTQEVIVFLIVAVTLAIMVRRSNNLVIDHAAVVRERTNLARYFSPNVVDELSHNDEPLKQVRTQEVAVLFVDIVGFTAFADGRDPTDVIATLREFHGTMEREVFEHNGTLDKYLGDGLMATFGTPFAGPDDARNALACAHAMITAVDTLNERRHQAGQPVIQASFGLHYGPVVLGDIGASRLEFAVIGNTVNVASRLEGLSRTLGVSLVASDAIVERARQQVDDDDEFTGLIEQPAQNIRGLTDPIPVWTHT